MAHKFNDVVHFALAGVGVIPAIVLNTRLEQRANSQEVDEVLNLMYAHPGDAELAMHRSKDVGDVKFGVKPFRKATDTDPGVSFGWADTKEAFGDMTTNEPPYDVKPDPVNSGDPSDHVKKQGTFHKAPLNEVLTPGSYLSERQTQGPGAEGSVQDVDLDKPINPQGQAVGAEAPEDQGGGQIQKPGIDQNPDRAVVDTTKLPPEYLGESSNHELEGKFGKMDTEGGKYPEDKLEAAGGKWQEGGNGYTEGIGSTNPPEEVFADPEGRTIGVSDGAGGYAHLRDNPFPPSAGQGDLTGVPISKHMEA